MPKKKQKKGPHEQQKQRKQNLPAQQEQQKEDDLARETERLKEHFAIVLAEARKLEKAANWCLAVLHLLPNNPDALEKLRLYDDLLPTWDEICEWRINQLDRNLDIDMFVWEMFERKCIWLTKIYRDFKTYCLSPQPVEEDWRDVVVRLLEGYTPGSTTDQNKRVSEQNEAVVKWLLKKADDEFPSRPDFAKQVRILLAKELGSGYTPNAIRDIVTDMNRVRKRKLPKRRNFRKPRSRPPLYKRILSR